MNKKNHSLDRYRTGGPERPGFFRHDSRLKRLPIARNACLSGISILLPVECERNRLVLTGRAYEKKQVCGKSSLRPAPFSLARRCALSIRKMPLPLPSLFRKASDEDGYFPQGPQQSLPSRSQGLLR